MSGEKELATEDYRGKKGVRRSDDQLAQTEG